MLAIEMAGGVYCPLSPEDPQHRLQSLLDQTESHCVLVHYLTGNKFQMNWTSTHIDSILVNNNIDNCNNDDADLLATVMMTLNNIAYITFTSGSTGAPKAVSNQTESLFK